MISKIKNLFNNLDKKNLNIMKTGIKYCFTICIIALICLFTYTLFTHQPNLYYFGISLFKLSCTFAIEFIICGIVMDKIKNDILS